MESPSESVLLRSVSDGKIDVSARARRDAGELIADALSRSVRTRAGRFFLSEGIEVTPENSPAAIWIRSLKRAEEVFGSSFHP